MSVLRDKAVIVFIHVFLAVQLLIPLSYYTVRADRNDERFAWRMFSSVRSLTCRVEFQNGPEREPVRNLYRVFHEAWLELSKRGRIEVVEAMAKELCRRADSPAPEIRAQITCTAVDGTTENRGSAWNRCRLGAD